MTLLTVDPKALEAAVAAYCAGASQRVAAEGAGLKRKTLAYHLRVRGLLRMSRPYREMRELTPAELGWLAGLMEGEGCWTFGLYGNSTKPDKAEYWQFRIALKMTDEDVVRRAHTTVGLGICHGPSYRYGKKPQWAWVVQKRDEVRLLTEKLLPLMGARRQEQMRKLLAAIKEAPEQAPATHGTMHTYKRLGCRCDACREEAARVARVCRRRRAEREGRTYVERSSYGRGRGDGSALKGQAVAA